MSNYIQKIHALNDNFFAKHGRLPSMFIQTFGCQMNDRESEKLFGLLQGMGYTEAPGENTADLILYNTCCVRGKAEEKVFGRLGRLKMYKKNQPQKVIVVCGCMPQREEVIDELKRSHKHVDVVFGTFNKHHFPQLLHEHLTTGESVYEILQEHSETSSQEFDEQTSRFLPHKAGVTIMHGCDNFCTYCIVPHVRGREKSRPIDEIMSEIEILVADGVKEILLLGQNVNSYAYGFDKLLGQINDVTGVERIRFMTSHPKDLSASLVNAIRDYDKVCKHLHLPIQSGSTRILELMNRNYTQKEYLQLIGYLRKAVPGIAVTSDIIVGFPGETEEDFESTLEAIEKSEFAGAFTFQYSPREGTPAAGFDGELPKKIVQERFERLLAFLNPIQLAHNKEYIGQTVKVMVDSDETDIYTGRTDSNVLTHFTSSQKLNLGDLVDVKITSCKTFYIAGEIV